MLTLLSPGALWSCAALALPLALHLWRQPPRTVRLGSLRFLRARAGPCWRNVRWRERLLLWVRLALLALLALLLARPFWRRDPSHTPQKWALLDPAADLGGPALARWQSLQKTGYQPHEIRAGLPVAAGVAADAAAAPVDLWSLLKEADAILPAGSSLAVFSPARLASLRGIRPGLRSQIEWVHTADAAGSSPEAWVQALHPAPAAGQNATPTFGRSEAAGTRFSPRPPPGWKMETRPDAVRLIDPANRASPWTSAPTSRRLKVLILHDADRAEDARYLAAALHAAVAPNPALLDLKTASIVLDLPPLPGSDWTFWLSAGPPSAAVEARRTQRFEDAREANVDQAAWIVAQPGAPGAEFLVPPARLWRRGISPPGAIFWTDEHGAPLLTRTEHENGPRWHFAGRLHPAWTDLSRTTALPAVLRAWLWPAPPVEARHDLRLAAAGQARSSQEGAADTPAVFNPMPVARGADLHWPCWTLAAFLFCLERVLSHRRTLADTRRPPVSTPTAVPVR